MPGAPTSTNRLVPMGAAWTDRRPGVVLVTAMSSSPCSSSWMTSSSLPNRATSAGLSESMRGTTSYEKNSAVEPNRRAGGGAVTAPASSPTSTCSSLSRESATSV